MNIRLATILVATALACHSSSTVTARPTVDAGVRRALRQQATVNLIVTMKSSTQTTLEALEPEESFSSRGDRIESMVDALQAQMKQSQRPLEALLAKESDQPLFTKYQPFWISNQAFIEGATAELIEQLLTLPLIESIREEIVEELEPLQVETASENTTVVDVNVFEWGVGQIAANAVWAAGNTGENVVVANIDSGVRYTHEAVKNNFRTEYGWFDPENQLPTPYDLNGHGTHTIGTIAGSGGIGVAPGSTWIACRGCRDRSCPESDLLSCAEFILCPTDTNGNNRDCSKAPHVVNNSWGGRGGRDYFAAAVNAWLAAGIIPIFANGNTGPACGTVGSPGDYSTVIAVGATAANETLTSFSSKGPAISGLLKPDISAPGHRVRSAWNTSDSDYILASGTSMAAPHVTGATALLLSAHPGLKFEDVRALLTATADRQGLGSTDLNGVAFACGGTTDTVWPNNQYGYGRLNVLTAIKTFTPKPTTEAPVEPTPEPTVIETPAPSER